MHAKLSYDQCKEECFHCPYEDCRRPDYKCRLKQDIPKADNKPKDANVSNYGEELLNDWDKTRKQVRRLLKRRKIHDRSNTGTAGSNGAAGEIRFKCIS